MKRRITLLKSYSRLNFNDLLCRKWPFVSSVRLRDREAPDLFSVLLLFLYCTPVRPYRKFRMKRSMIWDPPLLCVNCSIFDGDIDVDSAEIRWNVRTFKASTLLYRSIGMGVRISHIARRSL